MRTIVGLLLRQLTLMVLSFLFLYFFVLFFGANPDYFEWSLESKGVMGIFTFTLSVALHAYWYDRAFMFRQQQ
jgi:hypothetical protein